MGKVCCAALMGMLAFSWGCGDDTGDDDDDMDMIDAAAGDAAVDAASSNDPPVADFEFSPGCTSSATDPIDFTSTSTDPDGDPLTCTWTWTGTNNDPPTSGCEVTGVTFANFQVYTITLEVDDGNGGTDTASKTIGPCS